METAERLSACLGILTVVAVWLLQLKFTARQAPRRSALSWAAETFGKIGMTPDHVRVLAAYCRRDPESFTAYEFWREVAKLGGFLARRGDGEPGWLTLWRGWQDLDLMTQGARLAHAQPRCG